MQLKKFPGSRSPVTVPSILSRKGQSPKITALTAYDYTSGLLVDDAGADIVLVGDSLGSVIQGQANTIPVTLEEMIYHCRCVSRGVRRALIVGDMPFMSYQISTERALESAFKMIKEGNIAAVKLEGGVAVKDTVKRLVELDVPVMGHIGLTPQSIHRMGGFKMQGRDNASQIIADAKALEEAGVFSMVIEGVPDDLAAEITAMVKVPTIGIGAGKECDGQVIVLHDVLGLHPNPVPKFVKQYANLFEVGKVALEQYLDDVRESRFPGIEHSYGKRKGNEF